MAINMQYESFNVNSNNIEFMFPNIQFVFDNVKNIVIMASTAANVSEMDGIRFYTVSEDGTGWETMNDKSLDNMCSNLVFMKEVARQVESRLDMLRNKVINGVLKEYNFKDMIVRHRESGKEGIIKDCYMYSDETIPSLCFFPLKKDGTPSAQRNLDYPFLRFVSVNTDSRNNIAAFANNYEPVRPYNK